jgi:hypothetical protein
MQAMVNTAMAPAGAQFLALLIAGNLLAYPALAQSQVQGLGNPPAPVGQQSSQAVSARPGGSPTTYLPNRFAGSAGRYYKAVWGVDSLNVKAAESGELIRFTWRVLDPHKSVVLSDKRLTPSLEDPIAGVSLVIPSMENVGMLRQTSTPEMGKSYWMAFSNKGRRVRHGDRVNVVIGQFRADGLMVD